MFLDHKKALEEIFANNFEFMVGDRVKHRANRDHYIVLERAIMDFGGNFRKGYKINRPKSGVMFVTEIEIERVEDNTIDAS